MAGIDLTLVLRHLLGFTHRIGDVTAEDVIAEWRQFNFDDQRLALSLQIHLKAKAGQHVALPDGSTVFVVWTEQGGQVVDLWVQMGSERASLPQLVQAARTLIAAGNEPCVQPTPQPPVQAKEQLSLF